MNELINKQKNFFDVVSKIIQLKKLSHSYLIEINNYEEDFELVKIFIKMILCNTETLDSDSLNDEQLKICNLVDSNNYPDLKIIDPEGQWIKKNQLLELKEEYQNRSLLDNKRIYVITKADKLNSSSANTILKFLEEPEEDIVAILLTDNRYKVLDTILSRCQVLSLNKENKHLDIDTNLIELLKFIINGNDLFINYKYINENLLIDKNVAKDKLEELEEVLVDYLDYRVLNNSQFNEDISILLENVNLDKITKIISIIEKNISNLVYNVNYKIWLDSLFAQFVEV